MRRFKVLGGSVLAWLAVLVVAGAAIAGAVGQPHNRPEPPGKAIALQAHITHGDDGNENEVGSERREVTPDIGAEVTPDVGAGPNHGQCVSHAAHASKEMGFEGRAHGAFVSAIAQGDGVGPDCDLSAGIAAGRAAQDAQATEDHGNGGGQGQATASEKKHHGKGKGHTESEGRGHEEDD
jgi:hypothetical protein